MLHSLLARIAAETSLEAHAGCSDSPSPIGPAGLQPCDGRIQGIPGTLGDRDGGPSGLGTR